MPQYLTNDWSILAYVMAWCRQEICNNLGLNDQVLRRHMTSLGKSKLIMISKQFKFEYDHIAQESSVIPYTII